MNVWWLALALGSTGILHAQALGTVAATDATVTTNSSHVIEISGTRAILTGSSTVTAGSRTAEVSLTRGGSVAVCRTTGLHVAGSGDTLVLGIDRGAMEVHMKASASDVIMTPDLRMTMSNAGALDLRVRVSSNGDTCVENRQKKGPSLMIQDAFGEASYLVKPGQHVLFEHGSLREVVDRETTPCGCPPDELRPVPLAEALLHGGSGSVSPQQAQAAYPFPSAQSGELASPAPEPAEASGVTHTQVATTIMFDPVKDGAAAKAPATVESVPVPVVSRSETIAQGEAKGGPLRAIGRFFKHIFAR